jgi:hypothetical protein
VEAVVRKEYGNLRRQLRNIDSVVAFMCFLMAVTSYWQNEIFRSTIVDNGIVIKPTFENNSATLSLQTITLILGIATDFFIFYHYKYTLIKMKKDLKCQKSDTLKSSGLYKKMVVEMIFILVVYPIGMDGYIEGTMLDGSYEYSYNDLLTVT